MSLIEIDDLPELNDPVVIAAFEGWNDAGEAATGALAHLAGTWETIDIAAIDPEDYYDFQVNRPSVATVDGRRRITWPSTRLSVAQGALAGRDVVLVQGIEPSFRWQSFVEELLGFVEECDAGLLVCVGALLADSPHTRPFPVGVYSADREIRRRLELDEPTYEGPTGIVGILADAAENRGIPTVSAWVSVPHYAASSPSPKAVLALVSTLERLLSVDVPRGDLEEMSRAWERGVNELASSDEEIAEYVRALENANDAVDSPEASGDAIAREFERYLRRRDDDG
ncbi:MAG: PAC2 family protein [Dermatophilus congolensis]|nr:PAC2 family protein [Dermatophilus congolensis]